MSEDGYRFGFNGKENDRDFGNDQLVQDYGFRIYNPALGKFLSVDPLSPDYPWYTPYQFAGNKPIRYIDIDGLEEGEPTIYNLNQTLQLTQQPQDGMYGFNRTFLNDALLRTKFGHKSLWKLAWGIGDSEQMASNWRTVIGAVGEAFVAQKFYINQQLALSINRDLSKIKGLTESGIPRHADGFDLYTGYKTKKRSYAHFEFNVVEGVDMQGNLVFRDPTEPLFTVPPNTEVFIGVEVKTWNPEPGSNSENTQAEHSDLLGLSMVSALTTFKNRIMQNYDAYRANVFSFYIDEETFTNAINSSSNAEIINLMNEIRKFGGVIQTESQFYDKSKKTTIKLKSDVHQDTDGPKE